MVRMNKFLAVGRLTKDPMLLDPQDEKKVRLTFTLAIGRGYKKEDGADFMRCVVWGNYGKSIAQYLKKGKEIGVEGPIRTNSVKRENPETGEVTWDNYFECMCREVTFGDDAKNQQDSAQSATAAAEAVGEVSAEVIQDITAQVMAKLEAEQRTRASKVQAEGM